MILESEVIFQLSEKSKGGNICYVLTDFASTCVGSWMNPSLR